MSHLPPGDPNEVASGPGGPLPGAEPFPPLPWAPGGEPDDLVAAALAALNQFVIPHRYAAARLLLTWARYAELDPAQITEILSHYPSRSLRRDRPEVEK